MGRASFELARDFSEVIGVDYSTAFVDAALTMKTMGRITAFKRDSGAFGNEVALQIAPEIDRSRTQFRQGDASAMGEEYGSFDAVLACNLLCRLQNPQACLARMGGENGLVAPGGVLVVTSPHTWDEAYTPSARWLAETAPDSVEKLQAQLPEFEFLHQEDMPFMIREHRRKYEYIIAHATVWRRKSS